MLIKNSLFVVVIWVCTGLASVYGQRPIVNPKSSTLTVKKIPGTDLLIPIEMEFVNPDAVAINPTITINIDNSTAPLPFQFSAAESTSISIVNDNQLINLKGHESKKAENTFYLLIGSAVQTKYEKTVYLKINDVAGQLSIIKVNIQPDDRVLSLSEYLQRSTKQENRTYRLGYVTKVESNNNILTVSGYKKENLNDGSRQDVFQKRVVELKRGEALAVSELSWVANSYHWKPVPIALTTIPFKIRPSITANNREFSVSSTSGLTNLGFNMDLVKYQTDKYFSNGKKATHKFSVGLWAAPSVEELDSVYTNGAKGLLGKLPGKMEKSKQVFISAGITISYSYNDISFVIVPIGADYATSGIGNSWVYNKKAWWGFGIAVSPKIFAAIANPK